MRPLRALTGDDDGRPWAGDPSPQLVTDEAALLEQRRAWAIMFNYRTENEGIYSQQRADGEWIFSWTSEEDAQRYAEHLVAQDFPEGTAVEMDVRFLLEFCRDAGHTLCLVPAEAVAMPPEGNVEQFEWSPGVSSEASERELSDADLEQRRRQLESMFGDGGPAREE